MRMNDAVQAKLKEIVVRYGVSVIDDPLRCQGLLNDLCPSSRREISSLILVLKEGVPTDLMKAGKNTPRQALAARLSRQVADNVGLSEDVARWAVESWARAIESLPPAVQARHQGEIGPAHQAHQTGQITEADTGTGRSDHAGTCGDRHESQPQDSV
jgi:hypothetical protein